VNRGRHPARFFTRSAPSAQVGRPQAAGALAACCLWYTGIGRQSFPLSTLSAPTLGPSLLRQPPLSALPGRQKLAMARKANPQSLTDQLLPLRLHSAGRTQFPDINQPTQTLPALVRLRRTESAGVWAQPTPRRSRNHRCTAYLGTKARLPSPSSLHCHRWSLKSGWQTVALTQTAQVPLSRWSACRTIPRHVPRRSRSDACRGRVAPARFGTQHTCQPYSLVLLALQQALGPLCQTSLWRTEAGLKLPGQPPPPRCAEHPPYCRRRYAASDRHLHLSRLPAWLTAQGFNPLRPRVHPALQLAYPASRTGAYPTLWNSGQQSQKA